MPGAFAGGVIANVVRVVAERCRSQRFPVRDSQELQAGSLSVGDGNVGAHGGDPLRLGKTGKADQVRSRVRIDDFNRVVTERRDEELAGHAVEGEMIDSPFDSPEA